MTAARAVEGNPPADLDRCMIDQLRGLKFAARVTSATITFPFAFASE